MPTTNPVPSTDPSDLLFNARKLDEVVNGTANSFTDRLGVARRTVAGMNADFDAQLADAESDLNVYRADAAASAAEALGYLQTIRATSYGAYASDPATDPLGNPPTVGDEYFNTTANLLKRWNGTTWQASDISTANLAASSGSSLVGYDGGTVQDVLDGAKYLQDYTALRAYTGRANRIYITGPLVTAKPAGIAGVFQYDPTDTTSADNGGTIIVGADGRRWKRDFSGAVNVKWFGAKGDWNGIDGTDDTGAIQAALAFAYASATGASWRRDTPEVDFPKGKYRVAQPNALFAGLSFYNGKITGAGRRGGTEIVYDVPAATAGDYLLYNNDVLGFIQFHGIRFSSKNVVANQNFMYYRSIGNAQHFTWTECEWDGFSQIFNVQGPANASENTFYTCKFTNFSDCAFRFNNPQAVNWRFYACEAEAFSGALFEYLQGANVVWYQGSIIPTASTARILRVPSAADSNAFGSGNNPNMLFHAVRFEMRDGALMTDKQNSATGFVVIFDTCNMGGSNIPDPATYKAFTWVGAGKIELRSCTNLSNYRFNHSVAGTLNHILEVKIDNSPVPAEMISSSTFSITGGSTQNTGFGPTFYVSRCGSRVDGEYKVRDSQYMNNAGSNYNSVVKTRHAVAFSPETNTIAITSGGTFDLYVPPTRVIAVEIYPVANAGGAGQATITVKNAAGTVTLGTATYWIAAPGTVKLASDCNYFVDAMNGDYLKVEITHSYTAGVVQQFKGQMYLTY